MLWSILQYFWPALSDNWSWKPIFGLFESGRFTQDLLYHNKIGVCFWVTPYFIKWPLARLEWAILNIMWMGKYRAVFYFQLKSNEKDPLQSLLDWTLMQRVKKPRLNILDDSNEVIFNKKKYDLKAITKYVICCCHLLLRVKGNSPVIPLWDFFALSDMYEESLGKLYKSLAALETDSETTKLNEDQAPWLKTFFKAQLSMNFQLIKTQVLKKKNVFLC